MNPKGFVLIGMPGSGKTELGRRAAEQIGISFFDLDKDITQKTGRTPGEIITTDGEAVFRKIETRMLADYEGAECLLSTGGGIVTNPENLQLLRKIGKIIWIKRDIEEIANSVSYAKDRPLLRDRSSVDELWESRRNLYSAWSDIIFENTGNIVEAAMHLSSLLKENIFFCDK